MPPTKPTDETAAAVAIVSVTEGHRFTFPLDVIKAVNWLRLSSASIDCVLAWMADVPALALQPVALPEQRTARRDSQMDERQRRRVAASRWDCRVEKHGRAFRLTIPDPVRRLGLLPEKGGDVALVVYADAIELWQVSDFHDNLKRLSTRA